MPMTRVNDIDVNYKLEGGGPETIVLINGLADDLESWAFQVDDFLGAQLTVIQQHDTTARLGQLNVPALVLAGEQDILIPVSLSRRLADHVPGAEWATTKGGHACLWEHPTEFNQAFLEFIKRHGRG
jgi:fermentation-respiration switch protein FrsA (DUF1100 family)